MKTKLVLIFLSGITIFTIVSCSSSSQETKVESKTVDSSYVFDEIPPENVYKFRKPEKPPDTIYILQIGAFSTLENAKEFADYSRVKLNKDIKVEYKEGKKLYVVWIQPSFNSKEDARRLLNEVLKYDEYKDAWIVRFPKNK